MLDVTLTVTYFAFLLGFGVIVANICKKAKVPDTFFLIILGFILGPTIFNSPLITQFIDITLVNVSAMGQVPDFLRTLALIMIVFTGAFNLNFRVLKRFSNVSVNLAMMGIVFNTLVFGVVGHYLLGMEWVYSFLLAAIISGTGIEVITSLENVMKGSKRALTIMKIESIFNSPLTVLMPLIFLGLVTMEPGALFEPMKHATMFWQMIAAGVGTGLIVGLAMSRLMKGMLKQFSPLMLLAIALITYALTENIGGSGILAVAVCGIVAGNFAFRGETKDMQRFEDQFSEMLAISVFTLLGAQVAFSMTWTQFGLAAMFFLLIFISRPIFLIPALGKKIRSELTRKELMFMSFAAPRGLATAAMAPIVSAVLVSLGESLVASNILNITFLVVLLSILSSTVVAMLARRGGKTINDNKLQVIPPEKLANYQEMGILPAKDKPKKKARKQSSSKS